VAHDLVFVAGDERQSLSLGDRLSQIVDQVGDGAAVIDAVLGAKCRQVNGPNCIVFVRSLEANVH
jgi:hypothetical protein